MTESLNAESVVFTGDMQSLLAQIAAEESKQLALVNQDADAKESRQNNLPEWA